MILFVSNIFDERLQICDESIEYQCLFSAPTSYDFFVYGWNYSKACTWAVRG
jgi:hypothetical protein